MPEAREFEDPRFGAILVEELAEGWTVRVAGGDLTLHSPTGELSGADRGGSAWSGRAVLVRRTFDGHARIGDRRYRLHHRARHKATLVRDRRSIAVLRGDGDAVPEGAPYAIAWLPGTPDGTDARAGHLLATVWGVGARGALSHLGEGLFPGLLGA